MNPADFFDLSVALPKIHLQGGQSDGYTIPRESHDDFEAEAASSTIGKGHEYLAEYSKQYEGEMLSEYLNTNEAAATGGHFNDADELTSLGSLMNPDELDNETKDEVHERYTFKTNLSSLAIADHKWEIVKLVNASPVCILTGPTGCGKTTQVPQYLLEDSRRAKKHCNIIVTQPRRIAAITVARRVCEEQGWELGGYCGYKIGLQKMTNDDTRLTYVTVGVLLRHLVAHKSLSQFTHIILDEVHERSQDMDFLLLVVRKLLLQDKHVRIVLMSATIQKLKLAKYFSQLCMGIPESAPCLDIKVNTNFTISIHYLQELQTLGELPDIDPEEPHISDASYNLTVRLLRKFEEIDRDAKIKNSVLIFLPGLYEIQQFHRLLTDPQVRNVGNVTYKWLVVPLHSSLPTHEQRLVFRPPSSDTRKIILSTNIAESSITVPDIMFVIDFCLTKVLVTDLSSNFSSLQLAWACKDNCTQRAGRAGRVQDGKVYRMVPKEFYNEKLEDTSCPEMLRAPLDRVVLQTKLLHFGPPQAVLALALDPPRLDNIEKTVLLLKEVGGLMLTCDGQYCTTDGDLTNLGQIMAKLPVDVRITKLIALGYAFSVLSDTIVMGAAMSLKNMFSSPFKGRITAYASKLIWANGSCSDLFAFLTVYQEYHHCLRSGNFERADRETEATWAKRNFVQLQSLKEVKTLVEELTIKLRELGIDELQEHSQVKWAELEKPIVLRTVISGAFYPNYFGRRGETDEKRAVKELRGRDPFSTVYLDNYPMDQPPDLYSKLIKDKILAAFGRDVDLNITYDNSKVFIEFKVEEQTGRNLDDRLPGHIAQPVYWAIMMKELRIPIDINIMRATEAEKLHKKLIEMQDSVSGALEVTAMQNILPDVDTTSIHINITHVIDPGHFWVQYADEVHLDMQTRLMHILNNKELALRPVKGEPEFGKLYAAPYDNRLYRATVINRKGSQVQVLFIDFGNNETVHVSELFELSAEVGRELQLIPVQGLECILTGLRPSLIRDARGYWTEAAYKKFTSLVKNKEQYGEVYSVVSGVVSLNLIVQDAQGKQINVNQVLLSQGFAQQAQESYLSKDNHEVRNRTQLEPGRRLACSLLQKAKPWKTVFLDPASLQNCRSKVVLRGPHSPLETKVFSYTRGIQSKNVRMASDSVNSVILDAYPQDGHERMVVAGHVSESSDGTRVVLHNSTILPNIHGLPAAIILLFAPAVEFRGNPERSRYTGMVCGLGMNEHGKSLYPSHDMEVTFDVEMTTDDVNQANILRNCLSRILLEAPSETCLNSVVQWQKKIKSVLFGFLLKKRESVSLVFPDHNFAWNQTEPDLFSDIEQDPRALYQFHKCHSLTGPVPDKGLQLQQLELMHRMLNRIEPFQPTKCWLCDHDLPTFTHLRIHLNDLNHKTNEEELHA